jgi:hypothetical protein
MSEGEMMMKPRITTEVITDAPPDYDGFSSAETIGVIGASVNKNVLRKVRVMLDDLQWLTMRYDSGSYRWCYNDGMVGPVVNFMSLAAYVKSGDWKLVPEGWGGSMSDTITCIFCGGTAWLGDDDYECDECGATIDLDEAEEEEGDDE